MVNFDDQRSSSSNSYNDGQRRQSFTERMFGNARDWFQRSNSRDSSNSGSPFGSPPNGSSFDSDSGSRGRSRSLSTSYMFNHHRDLIIPGPVF